MLLEPLQQIIAAGADYPAMFCTVVVDVVKRKEFWSSHTAAVANISAICLKYKILEFLSSRYGLSPMMLRVYPVKFPVSHSHTCPVNLLIPFPVFPGVGCKLLHVGFPVLEVIIVGALVAPSPPNTFNPSGIYVCILAFPTLKSFARDCHDAILSRCSPNSNGFNCASYFNATPLS